MHIIQISDFHMEDEIDLDECKKKIKKLYDASNEILNHDEELIFCVCGDITNKGEDKGYQKAAEVINYIQEMFKKYNYKFEFIPGNHDMCNKSFLEFDKFISKYIEGECSYENNSVVIRRHGDINLILLNTLYHKDHKYGKIDLNELEIKLEELGSEKNIVVMHHTLISEYNDDNSAIRDAYKFIRLLENKNVCAILHGHTHGYSDISIAKGCKVIGVGPLFKKQEDISNQFNIINLKLSKINNIYNMRYAYDLDKYNKIEIFSKISENHFEGESLDLIYEDIIAVAKEQGAIFNFNMNVKTTLDKFNESINRLFSEYIKVAEEWQQKEVPNTLYYNHGQYMFKGGEDPIDYIVNELQRKPTSSRAIIPLINIEDVVKSGDNFLPSLDILQFGFNNNERNELYVTIYLRALEVNNFLKINISEIFVMINKIADKIRSITNLNINIFSFKAQYKEKFSCFRKADIDMIDESKLMIYVMNKKLEEIIKLLKNKCDLSETVVHIDGIDKLDKCINNYIESQGNEYEIYYIEILNEIKKLKEVMKKLKELREKTSIYKEIMEEETELQSRIHNLIKMFEVLKEK